ncbi:MAG: hypothetical protein LBU04_04185 [Christensenellaceae bacterium]|nr:hypothetical protein [Christensenellaceae bacterium]
MKKTTVLIIILFLALTIRIFIPLQNFAYANSFIVNTYQNQRFYESKGSAYSYWRTYKNSSGEYIPAEYEFYGNSASLKTARSLINVYSGYNYQFMHGKMRTEVRLYNMNYNGWGNPPENSLYYDEQIVTENNRSVSHTVIFWHNKWSRVEQEALCQKLIRTEIDSSSDSVNYYFDDYVGSLYAT